MFSARGSGDLAAEKEEFLVKDYVQAKTLAVVTNARNLPEANGLNQLHF